MLVNFSELVRVNIIGRIASVNKFHWVRPVLCYMFFCFVFRAFFEQQRTKNSLGE